MAGVFLRDRRGETQAQRGHVETEVELGGTQPHAQGCLEPPEGSRGRKEPPLGPVEGAGPALPGFQSPAWVSGTPFPELGRMIPVVFFVGCPVWGNLCPRTHTHTHI